MTERSALPQPFQLVCVGSMHKDNIKSEPLAAEITALSVSQDTNIAVTTTGATAATNAVTNCCL